MKDYERKMQAFNEDETDINDMGPDNDPGVPVDKQAKKTLKVIEKTLADATNLAATEVARVGGDVSSEEIKKLFEGVGGFFLEVRSSSLTPTFPLCQTSRVSRSGLWTRPTETPCSSGGYFFSATTSSLLMIGTI